MRGALTTTARSFSRPDPERSAEEVMVMGTPLRLKIPRTESRVRKPPRFFSERLKSFPTDADIHPSA
jgi:hypothetical protein